ncbi:hypothetical protein CDL15_Pgr017464 [Punica granatum]|uniref:Uncharacterized protein n=1 Tax=Punica granatum TaxID=22663 RepID=A0A218W4I6_PUNGR|nr:hypothetical protein CDL15_Pgr017464 [Punica granatum]PKI60093.1 hypothetical protein CRG98_019501 [Punica granatum]
MEPSPCPNEFRTLEFIPAGSMLDRQEHPAFARRRARLEEAQVHETDSLLPAGPSPLKPFLQLSGAPLEHEPSLVTPSPSPSVDTDNPAASDNCPPPVSNISKILADIADQPVASDNSECFVGNVCEITDSQTSLLQVMTLSSLQVICSYQKKLLNQIETVQKKVMDKLEKLKRTRAAKKAERERKVR